MLFFQFEFADRFDHRIDVLSMEEDTSVGRPEVVPHAHRLKRPAVAVCNHGTTKCLRLYGNNAKVLISPK